MRNTDWPSAHRDLRWKHWPMSITYTCSLATATLPHHIPSKWQCRPAGAAQRAPILPRSIFETKKNAAHNTLNRYRLQFHFRMNYLKWFWKKKEMKIIQVHQKLLSLHLSGAGAASWRQVHWVLAKRYFHISESINMCDSVTCWQTVTTHAKTVGITDIFPFIDSLAITITVFTSIECEWMCENAFTRMTVWNVIEYYHITYRLASSARMNRRIFLINSNVSGSKMWRSMYRSILTSSSGWRPRILFINWCTLLRLTFVSE